MEPPATAPPTVAISPAVNRAYSHGGYTGAAPWLVADPRWRAVLHALTPGPAARATGGGSAAAMRALENSPVLAAFGVARERAAQSSSPDAPEDAAGAAAPGSSLSHTPVAIEWDVYLCPAACRRVDAALAAAGGAVAPLRAAQLAAQLAASTVVAHGAWGHVLLERLLGVSAYSLVRARSGGMTVHAWLRAYAASLAAGAPALHVGERAAAAAALAAGAAGDAAGAATPHVSVLLDVKSTAASAGVLALLVEGLAAMGVHVWGVGSFRHGQLAGLRARAARAQAVTVLAPAHQPDLRAAHAALRRQLDLHESWAAATAAAAGAGGPPGACFAPHCAAHGLPLLHAVVPPPLPLHIFSFVGEVQRACDGGALPYGAAVLFNGGTLLDDGGSGDGGGGGDSGGGGGGGSDSGGSDSGGHLLPGAPPHVPPLGVRARLLEELDSYRARHGLQLGFYAQEPLLEARAVELLVATANRHPALFAHGFAFSGLPGCAAGDLQPPPGEPPRVGWRVPWWLRLLVVVPWRWRHRGRPGAP